MEHPEHFAAIFGGAVSGAEAANQLAQRGIRVVVFDQNALPYGKIEDGLPKWHIKLRDKEEQRINEKLDHPLVSFVPNVTLGRDIDFEEVARNWGFSAVILATGAWRDRPMPIEGIDSYINKGFCYQNPFIYWFNHCHEPDYAGTQYEIKDDAIVVGGGLASLDVVKVLMLETVRKALAEKGHEIDLFKLEHGIDKVLGDLGYTLDDLGVKGCTLYYRRRDVDMPLSPLPTDTPEQAEKAQKITAKILQTFQKRYLFRFEGCHVPVDKIVEDGRLAGMIFQKTKVENGKVTPIEGSETEVRSPLTISSIGSIPEPIEGIPMNRQTFEVKDYESCQIAGYDNVFAVGNAVTGRGNINESLKHAQTLTSRVMDTYLNWTAELFEEYLRAKEANTADQIAAITEKLKDRKILAPEKINELNTRIKRLQEKVGYGEDYDKWITDHMPKRMEDMPKA